MTGENQLKEFTPNTITFISTVSLPNRPSLRFWTTSRPSEFVERDKQEDFTIPIRRNDLQIVQQLVDTGWWRMRTQTQGNHHGNHHGVIIRPQSLEAMLPCNIWIIKTFDWVCFLKQLLATNFIYFMLPYEILIISSPQTYSKFDTF